MRGDLFAAWGALMVRWRWFVLGVWLVVLLGAGIGLAPRAPKALQTGGFLVPDSESTQAAELLDHAFDGANRNNLSVIFRLGSATVDDDLVRSQITSAEARLAALPGVRRVDSFFEAGTPL
ncbi:MAG TPA: MMPL family transporter, partial [Chloroflexota bacterium]|nr:MMPL family transporter [Chloroflexota bacterium]